MSNRIFAALVLVFSIVACTPLDPPPPPDPNAPVIAVWANTDVSVTNNTNKTVYFIGFPVRLAPVILITTDTRPNSELQVAAMSTKRFPLTRFNATTPDTLMFSWWHLGTKVNDSLYKADSVRTFRVFP